MASAPVDRRDFTRPIVVAVALTFLGEVLIFLVWGLWLFPGFGPLWAKAGWAATCGIAMGATAGAIVVAFVSGRLQGARAAWAAGGLYFATLAYCAVLCWRIDLRLEYFGGRTDAWLFLLGGWVPAALSAIVYGWLVFGGGRRFLPGGTA